MKASSNVYNRPALLLAQAVVVLLLVVSPFVRPAWSLDFQPAGKHILLLYSYGYGGRGVELFSDGFFKTVTAEGFPVADVYAEYLDLQRWKDDPGYRKRLSGSIIRKYERRNIDLIVTVQQPALEFLLGEGKGIAPGAPVIALQPRPPSSAERGGRRIIGELNRFDIRGTLERALDLFPKTEHVVFVSGSSQADLKVAEQAAKEASPWKDRLDIEYTTGMSLEEILNRASHLPPRTVIIFTQYNVDSGGRVALAYEVEGMIARVANAPVFGFYDYNLRNGGIGGSVISVEESGARAGRLAVDILKGKILPTDKLELREGENVPMFDWTQIQRWGGEADRLPKNSVFINRPPSAWEEHKSAIMAATVFILIEAILIIALSINIRRRETAEAAMARSEARFRSMFDGILDAVIFTDTERRIRLVNPAFTRLFGYDAPEVTGRTTEFLYADPADYAEQGRRFHKEAEAGSGSYEMSYRRRDGSVFWAESLGMHIFAEDGTVIGLMGTHRDVTERRRLEEQFRQAQKMEAVGQLAGGVAHDFNNILTAIIGYGQIAMKRLQPDDPVRHHISEILNASARAAVLTQSLLAFGRKQMVNLVPLDLSDLVKGFEKFLLRLIREDIVLKISGAEEALPVLADKGQMEQVIMNLVTNARDAMPEGGRLSIETKRVFLDHNFLSLYGSGKAGEYALMTVSDTGLGMDAATREKVFEPFFTTKEQGKGTGLGLSMVYGIVKKHEGFLNVYSEAGRGTIFKVYLPLVKTADAAGEQDRPLPPAPAGGTETILVAEDDEAVRNLDNALLTTYGYSVIEAVDGAEAIARFRKNRDRIKLVILDGIMPRMGGKEAFREIKTLSPGIKCIFVSGYAEDIFSKDGPQDPDAVFLSKPVDPDDLLRAVRAALDG